MLPKKNRADKKALEIIFKSGRSIDLPSLMFKFVLTGNNSLPRISFVVPKKIAAGAVVRNSLRRRGYNALKDSLPLFPLGITAALVFKKTSVTQIQIEEEIKVILNKLKK